MGNNSSNNQSLFIHFLIGGVVLLVLMLFLTVYCQYKIDDYFKMTFLIDPKIGLNNILPLIPNNLISIWKLRDYTFFGCQFLIFSLLGLLLSMFFSRMHTTTPGHLMILTTCLFVLTTMLQGYLTIKDNYLAEKVLLRLNTRLAFIVANVNSEKVLEEIIVSPEFQQVPKVYRDKVMSKYAAFLDNTDIYEFLENNYKELELEKVHE